MAGNGKKWFIVYCVKDESHSLIPSEEVVYDDSVRIGETVKFSYNKSLYEGVVKDFGDDHDELLVKLNKLNKKMKAMQRDSSFDASKPRKAAVRAKTGISQRLKMQDTHSKKPNPAEHVKSRSSKQQQKSSQIPPEFNKPSTSRSVPILPVMKDQIDGDSKSSSESDDNLALSKLTSSKSSSIKYKVQDIFTESSDTSSGVTDKNDSSSDEAGLTQEEKILLKKLTEKKKRNDLVKLKASAMDASKPPPQARMARNNIRAKEVNAQNSDTRDNKRPYESTQYNKDSSRKREQLSQPSSSKLSSGTEINDSEEFEDAINISQLNSDFVTTSNNNIDPEVKSSCEKITDTELKTVPIVTSSPEKLADPKANVGAEERASADVPMPPERKDKRTEEFEKGASKKRKFVKTYPELKFEGDFFRNNANTPLAEEVIENSGVYILSKDFRKMKKTAKTTTACARQMLRYIFSDKAIAECSVSGRPACGKGSNDKLVRPALHEDTVSFIIDYAKARANYKMWPCPFESAIRASMRSYLSEERANRRANAEAEESSS